MSRPGHSSLVLVAGCLAGTVLACGSADSDGARDAGAVDDGAVDAAIDAAVPCEPATLEGAGSEGDPYRVCAVAHLEAMRDDDSLLADYFVVTHDFDASAFSGQIAIATAFTGTIDGKDHTIDGLTLASTTGNQGLFRSIGAGGVVKNLVFSNVDVTSDEVGNDSGAIVVDNLGSIENVAVSGAVSGGNGSGMLAGLNHGTISASSSSGTMTGRNHVGGLVGSNYGTIVESFSTATVTAGNRVGGLVGSGNGAIERSYATGAVTGAIYVAGLAGTLSLGGRVSNCYASGELVTGDDSGGLVGDFGGTIEYSYAAKIVVGTGAGGLTSTTVGAESVVTDAYFDTSLYASSPTGTGLSHAEMQQKASFPSFDFDTVWAFSAGISVYPSLIWQLR